jgi:hypothetical protein
MAALENNQDKARHGGARKGAGRKAGSATQKTRAIADMAAASGITPLEVMLEAMNSFRESGDLEKAASFAKDAAPYIHPKLAAIEHTGEGGGPIDHNLAVQFVGVK